MLGSVGHEHACKPVQRSGRPGADPFPVRIGVPLAAAGGLANRPGELADEGDALDAERELGCAATIELADVTPLIFDQRPALLRKRNVLNGQDQGVSVRIWDL